jgi:pilus assembly protein CpaF
MDYATLLQFFPVEIRDLIVATDISDVMLNDADGVVKVFVDRGGDLEFCDGVTMDPEGLVMAIQNVARLLGSDIDGSRPFLDTRLPDGSRVAALYQHGAMTVTIRKFNRWYSTDELIEMGCLPASVCRELVNGLLGVGRKQKANALVSGGPGAGKSTLTKALIDKLPMDERIIFIERPREIACSHMHAVRWEASEGVPDVTSSTGWQEAPRTVAQLLVHALRNRANRIIIGEVREPLEAYELLQALNTGHPGSIATIHADSAADALYRLTDLALAAHSNLAHEFVEKRVRRSIDYVVHIERRAEGRRVAELLQVGDDGQTHRLYPKEEGEKTHETNSLSNGVCSGGVDRAGSGTFLRR